MKLKAKKIVSVLLVFVLVVASLSACKKDDSTDTKPEGTSDVGASAPAKTEKARLENLDGMEITIGDWWTTDETNEEASKFVQDTDAYRQQIFDKYNFKITRKNVGAWGDMQQLFTTGTMANTPAADLFYLYQEHVSQPLMNGLLQNLKELDTLDLSEEKWNPMVTDIMTLGSGIYGMNIEREPRGGLFWNKKLFKEAGINPEEPYDLQKSGQWTWEKLEEYCKKLTVDTNKDGQTDIYGIASFSKDFFKLLAATNGATFVGKKDGKFTNETGTQNFMDAMNYGVKLIQDGYVKPQPEGSNWDWFIAAFRDGEVAMQTAEQYQVSTWKSMQDDWGFVLFPKGPNGEMKTVPMDNIVVMPSCFDPEKARKIAFAYDLYTEDTPGWEDKGAWKESYYSGFKDKRAVDETLAMMREDKYKAVSYLPLISGLDYGDITYSIDAGSKTPTEMIQEVTPQWDSYINEMNAKYGSK